MSRPEQELSWVAAAQALVERTVTELDDLSGPSLLPGWSRGHVVTHLARNAEALGRLLSWARTGIETPMYPSLQAREADIEAGARRPHAEQLGDLRRTGAAFIAGAHELSPQHWDATVRTRHGPIPASRIPWSRTRELWLHVVDLDAGVWIDAIPEEIAIRLVGDVAEGMHTRVGTRIELSIPERVPLVFGPGADVPVVVSGTAQQLAGWLAGRSDGVRLSGSGELPELPPWL